jgi:CsoR family transcriptional regulator, copper-sensing transcriptional repressor
MNHDDLKNRIKRARGQIEGIERMLDNDRDCMDIVQQIVAVRSALGKLGVEILKTETTQCSKGKSKRSIEELIESLFKIT